MIDEVSRRRENFDADNSVPVTLADGQAWHFPKPWVRLWPTFEGGKVVSTYPVLTCGPRLDALIKAIGEAESNGAILSGAATLGAWMLLTQYDLQDADLDWLFCGDPHDPCSWDWARQIMAVVRGNSGPKAFRGGDS